MLCCYYPTTTIAIDDDKDFLTTLTQYLGITNCKSYTSPKKAVQTLQIKNPVGRLQSRIIKKSSTFESDLLPEDQAVLFNMRRLHEEVYNKNRFRDVSVIIIDYSMEEMNGLDVCESLKDHPAKKILLTGNADKEKLVIEAFNKGIIHRFINKSDSNFPNKLKVAISTLKNTYFTELNLSLLPNSMTMPKNLYHNPAYLNFTRSIQEQFDAVEYYLFDGIGSTLFVNAKGETT